MMILIDIYDNFEIDDDNSDAMTPVCTNPVIWLMMIKRNDYKW